MKNNFRYFLIIIGDNGIHQFFFFMYIAKKKTIFQKESNRVTM